MNDIDRNFSESFGLNVLSLQRLTITYGHLRETTGGNHLIDENTVTDISTRRGESPLGAFLIALSGLAIPFTATADEPTVPLHDVAKPYFDVGVGVGWGIASNSSDWPLLTSHFKYATAENCMKPAATQLKEGKFTLDRADRFVEFARKKGVAVVGHCLVWAKDDRTPPWFFDDDGHEASQELLLERMKSHIQTLVGRYKGRIAAWDVVNEALSDQHKAAQLRDSGWSRIAGSEFLVKAFEYAHAADPDAYLIYNDYHLDEMHKREKFIALLELFRDRKVPVNAIGIQGHFNTNEIPLDDLDEVFGIIREFGYDVVISELDIDTVGRRQWWDDGGQHREEVAKQNPYKDGCPPDVLAHQAEEYAGIFRLLLKNHDVISRVSFWNLHDGTSWLNKFPWERVNHPLLFDRDRQPKPAFNEVVSILQAGPSAIVEEANDTVDIDSVTQEPGTP